MTNSMTKRIEWIDTAKAIGLICVILGHLGVPYLSTWIYTFHMPLFFFLSGAVFSGGKYNFKGYLKRKLKSLVLPYFTLGGGILLFFCIVYVVQGQPISAYGQILKDFLVQEHYWTVWFLACLFLVEMIYYGLHALCGKYPVLATALSLLICVFGLLRYHLDCGSLPWNLDVALVAQFFFHCGYLLKGQYHRLEGVRQLKLVQKGVIALGLLALNAVPGFLCIRVSGESLDMSIGMYGSEILTFLSAFAGIFLVIFLSNIVHHKYLTWLGQNTMVIFAWHSRIIIVLCGFIYEYFGVFQNSQGLVSYLIYAAVTASIIFGLLVPITHLIKRSKWYYLFGVSCANAR